MPERRRVFVAEDSPYVLSGLMKVLKLDGGHTVPLAATTLKDALEAIRTFRKKRIQVAVIDANLQEGDKSGSDGRQMTAAIRAIDPCVKIIGISGDKMDYVDEYLRKENIDKIGEVVTRL